jgi:hypothetical protein
VSVVEIRDQIVDVELVVYYFAHLLVIPLLVVNVRILDSFVADLLKDSGVVLEGMVVVVKVGEPHRGLE